MQDFVKLSEHLSQTFKLLDYTRNQVVKLSEHLSQAFKLLDYTRNQVALFQNLLCEH